MQDPSEDINQFVKQLAIPPVPETLLELNSIIQSDDVELAKVAQVIQKDASISALVLKIMNSPLFARNNKVSSISMAVSLLGIPYTMNIVRGLLMKETFDNPGNNPPRFWSSPSNIALITASLTRRFLNCSEDEGYLLGLFHNVGHALIYARIDEYALFYSEHHNHPEYPITHFEDSRFGYDHARLGYLISKDWGLPQYLRNIILNHHNVHEFLDHGTYAEEQSSMKGMLAVLKIAEYIDDYYVSAMETHEWQRVGSSVLGYLGLSDTDFGDICLDMIEQLDIESH